MKYLFDNDLFSSKGIIRVNSDCLDMPDDDWVYKSNYAFPNEKKYNLFVSYLKELLEAYKQAKECVNECDSGITWNPYIVIDRSKFPVEFDIECPIPYNAEGIKGLIEFNTELATAHIKRVVLPVFNYDTFVNTLTTWINLFNENIRTKHMFSKTLNFY